VPPVAFTDLDLPQNGESSAEVAARVGIARDIQTDRFKDAAGVYVNADAEGSVLETIAKPDRKGAELLTRVAERFGLTARGYHRVLRVARTIADLECSDIVRQHHVAEAISFRLAEAREPQTS